MNDLEYKIEVLVILGFQKSDRAYLYHTDNGRYSLEFLLESDIEKLRKIMTKLYQVDEPVDYASQELIDVFGKDKALWLETAGIKKFDKPMILCRGKYLLSKEYIEKIPLDKLISDMPKVLEYTGIWTVDNVDI